MRPVCRTHSSRASNVAGQCAHSGCWSRVNRKNVTLTYTPNTLFANHPDSTLLGPKYVPAQEIPMPGSPNSFHRPRNHEADAIAILYILASAITCACERERGGTGRDTILTQAVEQKRNTDAEREQTTRPRSTAKAKVEGAARAAREEEEKGERGTSSADAWRRGRRTHQDHLRA